MCDLNSVDLIDLSVEDEIPCRKTQTKTESLPTFLEANSNFIPSSWKKRDSFENDPFDLIQRLADHPDDPFDVVEKEASLKAQQSCKEHTDVKLGNLLSLSTDNILDRDKILATSLVRKELNDLKVEELDFLSPTVFSEEKHKLNTITRHDTDSTPNSSADTSTSGKIKRTTEYRRRLLKLSISNSTFSSPTALKRSLESEDILCTPVSSMLTKATDFGEYSLAAESPLKLVDDEDSLSGNYKSFLDSEKKFQADLEMLRIPILSELSSPTVEQMLVKSVENSTETFTDSDIDKENDLNNLEAIKLKIKIKKEKINNSHQEEISSLIGNLKTLISTGEMVDENKKQATDLLESLSSALNLPKIKEMLDVSSKSITRQGTFNMDLQIKSENNNKSLHNDISSATYEGESSKFKRDFNIAEFGLLSPKNSPSVDSNTNNLQTDVNDVMDQLSKLLINNSTDSQASCTNPTFIVVMNTNQFNHSNNTSNQSTADAKLTSPFVVNYLENSVNDSTTDIARRRSQSLSLHDKVKIVRLPPKPSCIQAQTVVQESTAITTTPPSNSKEAPDFKTPARLRSNSYSTVSSYTPQLGMRRSGIGSENKNFTKIRKTQTLDTHHEDQHGIVKSIYMPSNNLLTFKPDLKKKFKQSTESIMKSSMPLKATIPVKKLTPFLRTSPLTPVNNTTPKITALATPLALKENCTFVEKVGYPSACSTPEVLSSPVKRTTGVVSRPRYSYISTTPKPKSSLTNSRTSLNNKRRTVGEFKSKSPLKSRVNNTSLAVGASAPSSKATAENSRLSTSAGSRISKTPVKSTFADVAAVKLTSRFTSRKSIGGLIVPPRNKENKLP